MLDLGEAQFPIVVARVRAYLIPEMSRTAPALRRLRSGDQRQNRARLGAYVAALPRWRRSTQLLGGLVMNLKTTRSTSHRATRRHPHALLEVLNGAVEQPARRQAPVNHRFFAYASTLAHSLAHKLV